MPKKFYRFKSPNDTVHALAIYTELSPSVIYLTVPNVSQFWTLASTH